MHNSPWREDDLYRGTLYYSDRKPIYWGSLRSITHEPFGEAHSIHLTCFTYPSVLDDLEHTMFDFTYQTKTNAGILINLVYNALATSEDLSYQTIRSNDGPELFGWYLDCVPYRLHDHKPSSHYVIDTNKVSAKSMVILAEILYNDVERPTRLAPMGEILQHLQS